VRQTSPLPRLSGRPRRERAPGPTRAARRRLGDGYRPPTRGSSRRRRASDSASRPWLCWSRRRLSWTAQLWSPGNP